QRGTGGEIREALDVDAVEQLQDRQDDGAREAVVAIEKGLGIARRRARRLGVGVDVDAELLGGEQLQAHGLAALDGRRGGRSVERGAGGAAVEGGRGGLRLRKRGLRQRLARGGSAGGRGGRGRESGCEHRGGRGRRGDRGGHGGEGRGRGERRQGSRSGMEREARGGLGRDDGGLGREREQGRRERQESDHVLILDAFPLLGTCRRSQRVGGNRSP